MIYYNGILCIEGSKLIKSEENPNGIINAGTLTSLVCRMKKRGIELKMRRGGYTNESIYAFEILPKRYRDAYIKQFGDLRKGTKTSSFLTKIKFDDKALKFFGTHLIDTGKHLPDDVIRQYANEASIFNALADRKAELEHGRARLGRRLTGFWSTALDDIDNDEIYERYPHQLPTNVRSLERKFSRYIKEGYDGLISQKYGNTNPIKITEEAGKWLIARFATPINKVTEPQLYDEYCQKAKENNWPDIKSYVTIYNYLHRPDIVPQWAGARYGELYYKQNFLRQHRTVLPELRDRLWYADGTKMNLHYLNNDGKMETCNVYEVIDSYSEVLLGYHISPTEDFEAQYHAFKMAIKFAGFKPQELKIDNQGGHKKLMTGEFLSKIAGLSIPTAPYNGQSKTIESVFGRFQRQYLHREWFFTGQNVTATKQESKANNEFILANKNNLPTLTEVKEIYRKRRDEWNNAKHHKTGLSRIDTYRTSTNPGSVKVEIWDIIDLFWMTTKEPSTYRNNGIEIQVKNVKYAYEVLTIDGQPDRDFYNTNIGKKFFTKFDPCDMSLVKLYEKDSQGRMRFVADAQPYITVNRAIKDQEPGDASFIRKQELANKDQRLKAQINIEDLMEEYGLHPAQHGLKMPKPKGNVKRATDSFGQHQKNISNLVPVSSSNDDSDFYDDILNY